MQVSTLMTPDPVTLTRDTSLDDALRLLEKRGLRHLPVVDEGDLVGVLSDRDLLQATGGLPLRVHGARGPGGAAGVPTRADAVMREDVVTVRPEDDIIDALVAFLGHGVGCLPVVDGGRLIGILTESDLLQAFRHGCGLGWWNGGADTAVAECMTSYPTLIHRETTLEEAFEIAESLGIRHLPVVQQGHLIGVVSDRDLRRARGVGRHGDTTVNEVMSRDVVTVSPEARLSQAADAMANRKFSTLAVVEREEVVGILSVGDILEHALEAFRSHGKRRPAG